MRVPRLADHPHMDDKNPLPPAGIGKPPRVFDNILVAGVLRRTGVGEGAAVDHDIVLQILDEQRSALRFDRRKSCLGSLLRRRSGSRSGCPVARVGAFGYMKGSLRPRTLVRTL